MNMNRNLFYGATVCWALIAVDVEQPDYLIIRYAARGTAGALAIIIGLHLVNGRPVF